MATTRGAGASGSSDGKAGAGANESVTGVSGSTGTAAGASNAADAATVSDRASDDPDFALPHAPTEPDVPKKKMTAKQAGVKEVKGVSVEQVYNLRGEVAREAEVRPDAKGGQSFDYGTYRVTTEDEDKAAEVKAYEDFLRSQNPDGVVVRDAAEVEGVGGNSFDYGGKPDDQK